MRWSFFTAFVFGLLLGDVIGVASMLASRKEVELTPAVLWQRCLQLVEGDVDAGS